MELFARVAVELPLRDTYHYRIPDDLIPLAVVGARVAVDFGARQVQGFIVALDADSPVEKKRLKPLREILDPEPPLTPALVALAEWVASYYHHPLGETLATFLPPAARAETRPSYTVSGEGAGEITESERALLDRIAQKAGGVPFPGSRALRKDFEELLKKGYLKREWKVTAPATPKGARWCMLSPGAPDPATLDARSGRLAALIDLLREGPLTAEAVRGASIPPGTVERAVKKGWVSLLDSPPLAEEAHTLGYGGEAVFEPTPEQAEALLAVGGALEKGEYKNFLLWGITGSGKTEVYIRAVEAALAAGKSALVLVPEIALTPQLLGRFASRLGDRMALLHSGLGERERGLQWKSARSGAAKVVVGTRSAVFAPLENLGLIVVDEEHDPSYKQAEGLRYNAKHVAMVRAREAGAVVLLGSATPDLETWLAAEEGRCQPLRLAARASGAELPSVELVDMRDEEKRLGKRVLVSGRLKDAVEEAIGRGEQALLFLNRRGFSSSLFCPECEEPVRCKKCSVPMTLHRRGKTGALVCHYCGKTSKPPSICPHCEMSELLALGAGTQKIEEEIALLWPGARVLRLDRDSAGDRGGLEILRSFMRREADILVGTQMVVKGHHFPGLTVVGVLSADDALHFADFRAGERTFQTLTQVAGRAGRDSRKGRVYVQTRNPHHPVLQAVRSGSFEDFAAAELELRKLAGFSPYRRLALVRVTGPGEVETFAAARLVADWLGRHTPRGRVDILGPAPAPVAMVRGRWRFNILLRSADRETGGVQSLVRALLKDPAGKPGGDILVQVDIDPMRMA
jgi:primosomal protein N' (replication factor Y)